MKQSLPVLGNVRVASPCAEPWESMTGSERVRHCGRCDLDVFNLSSMTQEEAESFVADRLGKGRTCIRFFQRKDGTMLTQDCPVGWRRVQKRMLLAAGAVVSFLGFGAIAAFAGARTLTCHTATTSSPLDSSLFQSFVAIFTGQPMVQPQLQPMAGEMIWVPPTTPVATPASGTTTTTTTP